VRKALCLVVWLSSFAALAQYEDIQNPGTVSAVQERLFRMRHELTLGIGVLPSDAFYKGLSINLSYTAHFTDSFAWQVGRGFYSINFPTGLTTQLEQSFGAKPTDFDEVQYGVGSSVVWTPLYGKMSFLNNTVTHFTFFGSAGASVLHLSRAGFRPSITLGLGMRLFANKAFSFRLELLDDIVVAPDRAFLNVLSIQLSVSLNMGGE